MEYTSDSDVSEDTQELVRQGLASVKRKRMIPSIRPERPRERQAVSNMDISSIRHPLYPEGLNGVSSTHDSNIATREIAIDRNHNTITVIMPPHRCCITVIMPPHRCWT